MFKKSLLILAAVGLLFSSPAWGYWIWTPETKKWTNPKNAPRESPQEQLGFAKSYYEAKDYAFAYKEFKKLVRHYPDAVQAPEAQYYQGLCLEEMDKLYEAYQAYQKIVDKYPFSTRMEDVLEREYNVAQKLLEYRKKLAGIEFSGENTAMDIFKKVIENSPYGRYAAASQYKIGLTLKAKGYFSEATQEFQKVLDNYPQSEWAQPATFQIALSAAQSSLDAPYDQTLTQEAKDKFKTFVEAHPDAELSTQAQEHIGQMQERQAESNYNVGLFYEKQKEYASAKIYYRFVIKTFPKSPWAQKALKQMQSLERDRL